MSQAGSFYFLVLALLNMPVQAAIYRTKFTAPGKYLIVEVLEDNLLHFELSSKLPGPSENDPIPTTSMVIQKEFAGPEQIRRGRKSLETKAFSLHVNENTLCVQIQDRAKKVTLTEMCPHHLDQYWKGITLSRSGTKNLYGLGQEFRDPGSIDGDWMGRVRHYGGLHGNKMVHFNGGDNGNTQIPILYGLGEGNEGFAIFLDQIYQQQWDFGSSPWTAEMYGDQIRWYFTTSPSLGGMRKTFMNLVGHPLVPPKKAFGLWLSEYGYRNWEHLESRLATMRSNHFPLDGFMLDLYWFGGIQSYSDDTSMGRLTWDRKNFPNPEQKLATLRDQGIGIVPIEESYIGKNLPEHAALAKQGFLVKDGSGNPAYLATNGWWGKGGMVDWSNTSSSDFWHQWKRVPLIDAGIAGHWLDLGEPEIYPSDGVYNGGAREPDVHNIYNLQWAEGIYRGYQKYSPEKRPFIMSRSGAAGIQRYGVAMWSGDIGSDLTSLASHQNVQMHMSLSGIDYYGGDIGGFHREALQGDLNEMYTQWFAYGMQFDIPGRPHTENLCQCRETAPDRVGHRESNLDNIRLRYRLIPYVYSLAHEAHLNAEPVFAPPLYFYQNDPNLRTLAREKMIGASLLATVVSRFGQSYTDVYLPKGNWFNFHTGEMNSSRGQKYGSVPLYIDGHFRLPLFAKAGAIIPMMYVDDKTMDSSGKRTDGTNRNELMIRVFAEEPQSSFTLYEDDGASTHYLDGDVRRTVISQVTQTDSVTVTIEPSKGDFSGSPRERDNVLEIVQARPVQEVFLNGKSLVRHSSLDDWEKAETGWFAGENYRTLVKSDLLPVSTSKIFHLRRNARKK